MTISVKHSSPRNIFQIRRKDKDVIVKICLEIWAADDAPELKLEIMI